MGQKGVAWEKDGHEQPAAKIHSVERLLPHLCSDAFVTIKKRKVLKPENCAGCASTCCYGQRLMELMRAAGTDYTEGRTIYMAGDLTAVFAPAPVNTSIRHILRTNSRQVYKG